ncbi:MAG: hypothetical protein AAGH64_07720 [Planctomycetota bacterium]
MLKRLLHCTPLAIAVVLGGTWTAASLAPTAHASVSEDNESVVISELLLSNGRTVRGVILEETATHILFELRMTGFPVIERKYSLTEIQNITRDVEVLPVAAADDVIIKRDADKDDEAVGNSDPDAAQLYYVRFRGSFGRDVSATPIAQIIEDINNTFDDAIPNTDPSGPATIVDPETREKHIVVLELDTEPGRGFDDLFSAVEFLEAFEHEIHARGRRIVMLVENAFDGAAFLPWLSNEIYFKTEGVMAVTSDLEDFDIGDDMVNEKQISLRIGRAQGYAVLGGHEKVGPQIVKAMSRSRYWLSVLWTGAEPRVELRRPTAAMASAGWEVLSDDGIDDREDTMQQAMRRPNDQLYLFADTAFRLGVSEGTVADRDELLFMLGVHRNYNWVDNNSAEILSDWGSEIDRYIELAYPGDQRTRPGKLWRELNDIAIEGNERERRQARGRRIAKYKDIRAMTNRVAEVVDPNGQLISMIELQMYILQTQNQLDGEN